MTDKHIMDITLTSKDDKGPLQMISGEQRAKWEAIERVARRLVHNGHLAVDNQPLKTLINHLAVTLAMPDDEPTGA